MDGDGARRRVAHDPTLERAAGRCLEAGIRAHDAVVECADCRPGDLEDALERSDDVLERDVPAVPELDSLAQLEDIGLAAVRRGRQRFDESPTTQQAGT